MATTSVGDTIAIGITTISATSLGVEPFDIDLQPNLRLQSRIVELRRTPPPDCQQG